jgi:hypothetical protein
MFYCISLTKAACVEENGCGANKTNSGTQAVQFYRICSVKNIHQGNYCTVCTYIDQAVRDFHAISTYLPVTSQYTYVGTSDKEQQI